MAVNCYSTAPGSRQIESRVSVFCEKMGCGNVPTERNRPGILLARLARACHVDLPSHARQPQHDDNQDQPDDQSSSAKPSRAFWTVFLCWSQLLALSKWSRKGRWESLCAKSANCTLANNLAFIYTNLCFVFTFKDRILQTTMEPPAWTILLCLKCQGWYFCLAVTWSVYCLLGEGGGGGGGWGGVQ